MRRTYDKAELQIGGVRVPVTNVSVGYKAKVIDETMAMEVAPKPFTVEFAIPLRGRQRRRLFEALWTPTEEAREAVDACAHRSRRVTRRRLRRIERGARVYLRQARGHVSRGWRREDVAVETLRRLEELLLLRPERRRYPVHIPGWRQGSTITEDVQRALFAGNYRLELKGSNEE